MRTLNFEDTPREIPQVVTDDVDDSVRITADDAVKQELRDTGVAAFMLPLLHHERMYAPVTKLVPDAETGELITSTS